MTTILIKKEMFTMDDKLLHEMGYVLKRSIWSKKIDILKIREEIERIQVLKISGIEVQLD